MNEQLSRLKEDFKVLEQKKNEIEVFKNLHFLLNIE